MMSGSDMQIDRAEAVLYGLAIGDALGMPSQTLSRDVIRARYGKIEGFVDPFDGHPISHGLTAAQVTDDTEQALLLAQRLLTDPDGFDDAAWARDLLEWEARIRAIGLRDLLGPSTKSALDALLSGTPPEVTGQNGTTNGAAMRIAPLGIMTPPDPARIARRVAQTCRVTHNTGEAIAAAAAVAMVVSAGVGGASLDESLPLALDAARLGQAMGNPVGAGDMADRIGNALTVAKTDSLEQVISATGTSVKSHESVAAAFGLLALAKGDGWQAMLMAANIGDDTDTIGAMAGAMAGACSGMAGLPQDAIRRVEDANDLNIPPLARRLVVQRQLASEPG